MKILIIACLLYATSLNAQTPTKIWDKTFGGTKDDPLSSVIHTIDGGYIVCGQIRSADGDITDGNNGETDLGVIKLDALGNKVWDKTLGGSSNDNFNSVIQTNDGGYLLCGYTESNNGDISDGNNGKKDIWIIKLNANGIKVWDKTFGGSGDEAGASIIQTSDGQYIFCGSTESSNGDVSNGNRGYNDIWIVKINSNGNKIWDKTFGGSGSDNANHIIETPNGEFVLLGHSSSKDRDVTDGNNGESDIWVVKISSSGNKIWDKTLGGSKSDLPYSNIEIAERGYIFCGITTSNDGDITDGNNGINTWDVWVVKITDDGTKLWDKTYGGQSNDYGNSLIKTYDGNYIFCGITSSTDGDVTDKNKGQTDIWLVKITPNGSKIWDKTLGGSQQDIGKSIIPIFEEGYMIFGYSNSSDGDITDGNNGGWDMLIIKLLNNPSKNNCSHTAKINTPNGTSFCLGSSVSITAEGSGTTSPFTYKWKQGTTDAGTAATLAVTKAGTYTVEVTDKENCTVSASVDITQTTNLPVNITGSNSLCAGKSTTLTANVTGGISPYTYQWKQNEANVGTNTNIYSVTLAGSYSVGVTDSKGCTGTSSAYNVIQNPNVTVSTSRTPALLTGESVVLSVPTASGQTYQWAKDGVAIAGATNNSYSVSGAGSYTVTVTGGGCTATSLAVMVSIILANEPLADEVGLRVSPNPTVNQAKMVLQLAQAASANVQVLDASGKRVRTWESAGKATRHEVMLDMRSVAAGSYVVQAEADGQVFTEKLVKQ
jgi:hypothetical protein